MLCIGLTLLKSLCWSASGCANWCCRRGRCFTQLPGLASASAVHRRPQTGVKKGVHKARHRRIWRKKCCILRQNGLYGKVQESLVQNRWEVGRFHSEVIGILGTWERKEVIADNGSNVWNRGPEWKRLFSCSAWQPYAFTEFKGWQMSNDTEILFLAVPHQASSSGLWDSAETLQGFRRAEHAVLTQGCSQSKLKTLCSSLWDGCVHISDGCWLSLSTVWWGPLLEAHKLAASMPSCSTSPA